MTRHSSAGRLAPAALIFVFAVAQLALVLRLNINWDEFFFLSHVYAAEQDRLATAMQTFHVRLLGWLTWLPLAEPDQIIAGRFFMMLCEFGSLYCLYRIARRLFEPKDALFAVAAWCAAGYALAHGASFRADPLASFLMMASLAVLACAPMRWFAALGAGVLAALGLLVTMKAAFYLPAFAGVLALRLGEDSEGGGWPALRHFAAAGAACVVSFAALWLWHANGVVAAPMTNSAGQPASAAAGTLDIVEKVFLSQSLFPRWPYIAQWMSQSLFTLLLCALGIWTAVRLAKESNRRPAAVALLLFGLPLVSLAIYRNAFSYYFPFMMLPVCLLAASGATRLTKPLHRTAILAGMAILIVVRLIASWPLDQSAQREIAAAVHEAFPEPVPYIDRNGMIPSFPKSGFFMSTWGTEQYLAGKQRPLSEVIAEDKPPLLILNTPLLEDAVTGSRDYGDFRLLESDAQALRGNYIPHWGPVWVAGKTLDEGTHSFDVLLPGEYTLECEGAARLDGKPRACGNLVTLSAGSHRWTGPNALLRWGDRLPRPSTPPPAAPLYYGF